MPKGIYLHKPHTEETKKKISEKLKGIKRSEETKKKMRAKHLSEEHKKKISETRKKRKKELGYLNSPETRKKISETNKGKNNWLGKHHTEETKRKLSLIIKERNSSEKVKRKLRLARLKQKLPIIDTSIERKTEEWLKRKGINYIHPFNLGDKFQCDFYLPFLNLIIECDGFYWHNRPDMKKRDKSKDAYAKKCGFNIIRLTEEQINKGQFIELKL